MTFIEFKEELRNNYKLKSYSSKNLAIKFNMEESEIVEFRT